MSEPVKIEFKLLDTIPEIQTIQLFMEANLYFRDQLTTQEMDRAVDYFYQWYMQTSNIEEPKTGD